MGRTNTKWGQTCTPGGEEKCHQDWVQRGLHCIKFYDVCYIFSVIILCLKYFRRIKANAITISCIRAARDCKFNSEFPHSQR